MGRDEVFATNQVSTAAEEFDGETVIIHFDRGTYFSLGGSASAILAMLRQPTTIGGMMDAIRSGGLSVPPDYERALTKFMAELAEHDLIRPAGAAVPTVLPSPLDASAFAKPPALEAFTDLAELIKMDPVHEVDAHEGWPRRPGEEQAKN